ncbi:MAG: glycosyltransferase [Candidatus Omnitrophota bacterium]
MKKVFHFVPSLDIGGVEIAIKKSLPDLKQKLDISIFYIKRRGSLDVGQKPWWLALKSIVFRRPDVVITSLWWSHPIGFLFKISGIRWVCFIHNSRFKHFVDRFICSLSIWYSDEVAADSNQAAVFVRLIRKDAFVRVIPYVFLLTHKEIEVKRVKNTFIYVGRNASEKRMDLVAGFFEHLMTKFPAVRCRFEIAGEVPITVLNLKNAFGDRVSVKSNSSNTEVYEKLSSSEYFVVLSDLEGFCMSAYEAVQAGCFVIYRDVGEIKNYVIPDRSFRVIDLENLYDQFDEVLEARNKAGAVKSFIPPAESLGNNIDTYNYRFIDMVESRQTNSKGDR